MFKTQLLIVMTLFLGIKLSAQVNLSTGSATFSLPMFSWQDDKSRLNAVVALNYNSGNGLKVDDVASNVGQGWNLLAGGVITRMQVGEPDDQRAYVAISPEIVEDESKYPAGYLYNPDNILSKGCPIPLKKYPLFEDKNHVYKQNNIVAGDRELDYFSFQFNGRSGMFVLQKNSNRFLFLGDSKLMGWYEEDLTLATHTATGIRTTITAFNIQDESGLVYRFANYSKTKVLKTSYCDANQIEMQTQPHFDNNNVYHEGSFDKILKDPYVINGWYLTSITDLLTNRVINFTYNNSPLSINNNAGNSIAYYTNKNYSVISHRYSKAVVPQLTSIIFPDQHLVTLTYNSTQRFDLSGDYALSSVDISYQGRSLSKYVLNTTYFIKNRYGTPTSLYQKSYARLCLRSVKKIGVDLKADDNPYIFDYYFGTTSADDEYVPSPFCYAKDIWGFYNGKNSKAFSGGAIGADPPVLGLDKPISQLSTDESSGLCFRLGFYNSKNGYAKNGLLRQIIYPTGGSLTYEYVQNRGSVSGGVQQDVGGVHVSKTSLTDGGFSNGCSNPIETSYNYVLSGSTNSSLWGMETPDNSINARNGYAPEHKIFYAKPWKLEFGCKYIFQYPGILSREDKISLTDFQKFMNIASTVLSIVGVITTVMDVVTLIGDCSVVGYWVAVIVDIIGSLISIVLTCATNVSKDTAFDILYNFDLNSINPLPVQFSRVEVVQATGGIGKTVHEFTSSADYPLWDPSVYAANSDDQFLQQQSMKQRYAYWAYGLPEKITAYDVNGYKISETEYEYDYSNAKHYAQTDYKFINNSVSWKCLVLKNVSQRSEWWDDPMQDPTGYNNNTNNFLTASSAIDPELRIENYNIYSGRIENTAIYERTFKPNSSSQYIETVTRYQYNTDNYQPKTITTIQSNGDQNIQEIRYTSDYSTAGILGTMVQNNIVGLPVESSSYVLKNGVGPNMYLSEKVTEFTQLSNGDIKPQKILEQRFNQPQSSMTIYNGPGTTTTPPYNETQVFIYNDGSIYNFYNYGLGNLIGIKDEGGHSVTNIYDYDDKYVIASVINADPLLDKSAYTSFETDKLGGWTLTGAPVYATGFTGSRSFTLSSGKNLKVTSLNTAKSYRVSFWSTASMTVAGSATLVKSAPTINGFTYYEYKIAQGTASVTVSGTGNIDELRLYPETARMRTVTYDPLIGKTSECDENNRITYYEYDEKARLKLIRDENNNIVKMYEYNIVSNKQAGCPGAYSNRLISEIFTKSNCGSGYIGGTITYTVPAGKYTSNISQQDADQQAENEINTYGQASADNSNNCKQIWKNVAKSQNFTTEGCSVGYEGGTLTYTVPANKYISTVSQADADLMAQIEIDANGQAYANSISNKICNINYNPYWQGNDTSSQRCQKDANQNYNGHIEVFMHDVNPNSSSYGAYAWQDAGFDGIACQSYPPNLIIGDQNRNHTNTTSGGITGVPGTVKTITVTLNSSDASATLTGNTGFNVNLSGSGNHSITNTVTIPAIGYIGWNLTISIAGTLTSGYVSSSLSVQ